MVEFAGAEASAAEVVEDCVEASGGAVNDYSGFVVGWVGVDRDVDVAFGEFEVDTKGGVGGCGVDGGGVLGGGIDDSGVGESGVGSLAEPE